MIALIVNFLKAHWKDGAAHRRMSATRNALTYPTNIWRRRKTRRDRKTCCFWREWILEIYCKTWLEETGLAHTCTLKITKYTSSLHTGTSLETESQYGSFSRTDVSNWPYIDSEQQIPSLRATDISTGRYRPSPTVLCRHSCKRREIQDAYNLAFASAFGE